MQPDDRRPEALAESTSLITYLHRRDMTSMCDSVKTRLAWHQDALATLRDLQQHHPFVAGTAGRLAEIVEADIRAFKSAIKLLQLEEAAGGARLNGVDVHAMRQSVEAQFEQRRRASTERNALKQRIEEFLMAIAPPDTEAPKSSDDRKALEVRLDRVVGEIGAAPTAAEERRTSESAEERAAYVGKILKELNVLKGRGTDCGDIDKLRREYPRYETLEIADGHWYIAKKLEALPDRKRPISLALDIAVLKFGKARPTIETDWKRHKPAEFRQSRSRVAAKKKSRSKKL